MTQRTAPARPIRAVGTEGRRPRRTPRPVRVWAGRVHRHGRRPVRAAPGVRPRRRPGGGRARASGSRPWPRPIRDLLSQRWLRTERAVRPGQPQAGLLPVDGVPDRPVAGQQHHQPACSTPVVQRRRAGARGWTGRARSSRSPTPAWATAASAGWPPASSTRWPRCRSRPSATACATSTACSARRSRDGCQVEQPDNWLRRPDPWEVAAPERDGRGAARLPRSRCTAGELDVVPEQRRRSCSACPTIGRSSATAGGRSTRCGSGRPRRRTTSTSASSAAATSSAPCHEKVARRDAHAASSTPTTRRRAGRALRFVQEYFLVACSLADIVAPVPPPRQRLARAARQGRHPAQRHAPGAGRRRADAHPARRGRARLGRGVGPDACGRWPTPTTRCCPRRWRSGRSSSSRSLLPRQLEIIYEINRRFLDDVRARYPGDEATRRAR